MAIIRTESLSFPFSTDSPFLFGVHHDDLYPKGNDKMGPDASLRGHSIGADFGNPSGWSMYHGEAGVPGFPQHPHRGFETVTVTVRGFIDHVDSLGAAGRFGDGDVQWMTAGSGISHAEMFPCLSKTEKNQLELFQIWLNLPKRSKMVAPYFKMLWGEEIPSIEDKGTTVKLIAGAAPGFATALPPPPNSYANDPASQLLILTIKLEPGASYTVAAASGGGSDVHRNLYLYTGGACEIDGRSFAQKARVKVHASKDVKIVARDKIGVLVLQGRDLNEPCVQHGPFVGCTSSDIRQAFSDYQRTGFGGWPWPAVGVVHKRNEPRFALYPDGQKETRPRRAT